MSRNGRAATGTSAGSLGFGGMLTLLFIALKLCGQIDWSWWWVLAPVWIPGALMLLLLAVAAIAYSGAAVIDARARHRRARAGQARPHEHGPARRWP